MRNAKKKESVVREREQEKKKKKKKLHSTVYKKEDSPILSTTPSLSLAPPVLSPTFQNLLRRVAVVRVLEQRHLLAPPVRLPDGEDGSGVELFVGGRDVVLDLLDVPPVGAPDQLPGPPFVAGPVLDVVDALGAGVRDHGLDRLGSGGVPSVLGRRGDVRGKLGGGGDAGDLARFFFRVVVFVVVVFFSCLFSSVRFDVDEGERRRGVEGTLKGGGKERKSRGRGSRSRIEFFVRGGRFFFCSPSLSSLSFALSLAHTRRSSLPQVAETAPFNAPATAS